MRAYLGRVDNTGLKGLLGKDATLRGILREQVDGWTSTTTIVLRATIAENESAAFRWELLEWLADVGPSPGLMTTPCTAFEDWSADDNGALCRVSTYRRISTDNVSYVKL
jgi:hypothetical protein